MNRSAAMLGAVVQKEVRQTIRDKRMMALLMLVPLIQLFVFGHAVNLDVDEVPTVVVDQDQSPTSRRHLSAILADGTLREIESTPNIREANERLVHGDAAVVLVMPPDFERRVRQHRPTSVQAILDGGDPNRANVAFGAVSAYFTEVSFEAAAARTTRRTPNVRVDARVLFNPQLETAIYMVPGVAAMLLLLITTIVAAMGLSREKETGTLEQVLVTPVPAGVLILGKIIPFAVIGLLDFLLAIVVGNLVFDMPIRGSMPLMLLATSLYLLTTLGIGLLISTLSGSQQQAFLGGFFFLLPAALLSGIMTPIHSMPPWLQPFTLINPLRHYAEILRASLLRGAGFEDMTRPLFALAVMGVVIFTYASQRFRAVMTK